MKKHAYLIMAHTNFNQLKRLIMLLDDVRNDIYVHIDKKAQDVPLKEIRGLCMKSKLSVTQVFSVVWGTYSIVEAELYLLAQAVRGGVYLLSFDFWNGFTNKIPG